MNIKEYLHRYNISYQEVISKYRDDFDKKYNLELGKNWIVPVENKLDRLGVEDRTHIEKVIYKLKYSEAFEEDDISILSTFISKINSIVNIGNRLNNFKQGTSLEGGNNLNLVKLFNEIARADNLKDFSGELNANLKAFLPHLFSVIKHCQDYSNYPIYYKFWKQISKEVLMLDDDYDTFCSFYRTFPIENRTTSFGAYFGLLAQKLIENLKGINIANQEKYVKYLKDRVINLEEYSVLMDNLPDKDTSKSYWLYQPGEDARFWNSFQEESIIGLGWNNLGDLSSFDTKEALAEELRKLDGTGSSKKNDATANWDFYKNMQIGDVIIVKQGRRKLLGYGEVVSDYYFDAAREDYKSLREVNWLKTGDWEVTFDLVLKTLTEITRYDSEIVKGQKYYDYLLSIMGYKKQLVENHIIDLLKYKNQIILQGPPGTGKTREAKLLAKELVFDDEAMLLDMSVIKVGEYLYTPTDKTRFKVIEVATAQQYFRVKSDNATKDYTVNFNIIRKCIEAQGWNDPTDAWNGHGNVSYLQPLAKVIYDRNTANMESNQIKTIQFHPSYTYEDFVRGIASQPNPDGDGILYEAEEKSLGKFAKIALDNYLASSVPLLDLEEQDSFEAFIDSLKEQIAQSDNHKYNITDAVYLFSADETRFKYKGDNWVAHSKGLNMKFSELKKIIDSGATERQDIKRMSNLEELTRQHATYFIKVVEKYYAFKRPSNKTETNKQEITLKNYVLIIDEINRANLSSVLGELIYALEYRGEAVESMYAVEGENKLTLPPNLYIIGTMNTADRSVGHIDYAIRRRFAFVDVLPRDLSGEEGIAFDKILFERVSELFDSNLSPEFEKKDVQLGHSYFIDKSEEGGSMFTRLQYEIKPILLEYVKDGVLIGDTIKQKIDNLKPSI